MIHRAMKEKLWASTILAMALLVCCVLMTTVAYAEDGSLLQNHGTFIVAYSNNHFPFSDTDTNGNPTGIAINIMDYIAQQGDFNIEYVTEDRAREHNISVDINLAILAEDQLPSCTQDSTPYGHLQLMVVSPTKVVTSQGATFGHLPYEDISQADIQAGFPGATVYTYFSYNEMAKDYVDGRLDYMLVTSLVADAILESTAEVDSFVVPTHANLPLQLHYSRNLSAMEILALDELLASLNSEYVFNLMLTAVMSATDQNITVTEVIQEYAVFIIGTIILVFALLFMVIVRMNRAKQQALNHQLNVDELTGLMTEKKFLEATNQAILHSDPGALSIISIDINNFKSINEIYGYEVGTETIVRFGKMLQSIFPSTALLGRFFADNFIILHQGGTKGLQFNGKDAFERCLENTMHSLLGENYRMTISAGIYRITDKSLSLSYMIDCANVARRQGKINYNNSKNEFNKDMEDQIHQTNDIVLSMEQAMENGEFQVYYQPKMNLKTGKLEGAEALIRWIHPDGSMRFPDEFIPIFESNGFIVQLDLFVLGQVCDLLVAHPHLAKVVVNFSGLTMLEENLVPKVNKALSTRGLAAKRLEIEITESAVINNFDMVLRQTAMLKKLGVTIAMDDFGAGISSLHRLNDMDFDVLKIDKAFLGQGNVEERNRVIIHHIISMAHELGIKVVAEGVEHKHQEALLTTMDCDITQGYYYARPMSQEDYLHYVHALEQAAD